MSPNGAGTEARARDHEVSHAVRRSYRRRVGAVVDDRPRVWYRWVDWQASVWIIFLVIPLITVTTSDLSVGAKTVTDAGVLGFMIVYVHTVSTMPTWQDLPPGAPVLRQLRPVLPALGVLAVLTAVSAPVLGWWAWYYLPFFAAIVLFATPLTTGLPLVTAAAAMGVLLAFTLPAPVDARWAAIGCAASSLSIVAGRIGEQIGENRRTAERELVAAREREEISRDVHDVLGHSLTVLTLKAEVAQRLVAVDPERAEAELAEIVELSRAALADVRATVTRLRTPDLTGQIEASRTAFAAAEVHVTVRGRASDVPLPQRELLSWALREATTNVLRHAGAHRVEVAIGPGRLRVVDDGVGLRGAEPGNGLTGLRERVEAAGGTLRLTSPAPRTDASAPSGPGTQMEVVL